MKVRGRVKVDVEVERNSFFLSNAKNERVSFKRRWGGTEKRRRGGTRLDGDDDDYLEVGSISLVVDIAVAVVIYLKGSYKT